MAFASSVFNKAGGAWDVSNVIDANAMNFRAVEFNQDLTKWDLRSAKDTDQMFDNAHDMQSANIPASLR